MRCGVSLGVGLDNDPGAVVEEEAPQHILPVMSPTRAPKAPAQKNV
jgi:hypothetical protein